LVYFSFFQFENHHRTKRIQHIVVHKAISTIHKVEQHQGQEVKAIAPPSMLREHTYNA